MLVGPLEAEKPPTSTEELSSNGGMTGGGVDILDEEATPSDPLLIVMAPVLPT